MQKRWDYRIENLVGAIGEAGRDSSGFARGLRITARREPVGAIGEAGRD